MPVSSIFRASVGPGARGANTPVPFPLLLFITKARSKRVRSGGQKKSSERLILAVRPIEQHIHCIDKPFFYFLTIGLHTVLAI